jgi:fumarate reductase subunit D
VRLLEAWLDAPHEVERRSSRFFLWLGLGLGALVLATVAAGVILLVAVVRLVAGG